MVCSTLFLTFQSRPTLRQKPGLLQSCVGSSQAQLWVTPKIFARGWIKKVHLPGQGLDIWVSPSALPSIRSQTGMNVCRAPGWGRGSDSQG